MSKKTEKPREEVRGQVPLRQGDITWIPTRLLSRDSGEGGEGLDRRSLVVVASHDCDIYAAAKKEPYVEVILVELVEKVRSQYAHTRNSRLLDVEAAQSGRDERQAISIDATQKQTIAKRSFWDLEFDRPYSLDRSGLTEFVNWLSARYRRAALPNEFGSRFSRVAAGFWKLLEEFNNCTSAVLLLFDEGQGVRECAPGEPYIISIYIVCPEGEDADSERFTDLTQRIYDVFGSDQQGLALNGAPDIEVRQCLVVGEDEINLKLYNEAIHLSSDWISYKAEPPGPVLGS